MRISSAIKVLTVRANYIRPVLFTQERIDIGALGPKEQVPKGFICWSPTRELEVKPTSADPRIKVEPPRRDQPIAAENVASCRWSQAINCSICAIRSVARCGRLSRFRPAHQIVTLLARRQAV